MAKNLNITIPQPCHQNWAAMTPDEKGRHCSSCNKVVVDFTTMSDNQLVEYFKATPAKTCGHFRTDQLNRNIRLKPVEKPLFPFKYIAASIIATGGLAHTADAKDLADTVVNPVNQTEICADDITTVNPAPVDSCETSELDTTMLIGDTVANYNFPVTSETIVITVDGGAMITLGYCVLPESPDTEFELRKPLAFKYPPFTIPYVGPILESWQNHVRPKPDSEKPAKRTFNFSFAALVNRLRFSRLGRKE